MKKKENKTKWNQKNKRIVKRDERCDKEINIKHGGYECRDKGVQNALWHIVNHDIKMVISTTD